MNSETKICQNCKHNFTIESEDFDFYKKIQVPAPTFCPPCRMQRRFAWRNDRSLYKRKCDKTGESIISIYSEDKPFKVYSVPAWWGDDWNALEYGEEYDFTKPFFEQFKALMSKVPLLALFVVDHTRMLNSPYNNMVLDLKNCYMMTNSDFDEDCYYGTEVEKSKNCVDLNLVHESELCYEIINCQRCFSTFFSEDCQDCQNVWFSRDCVGCSSCFGCVNLRKKSYCIFNEQYTKEEYEKKMESFNLRSRASLRQHLEVAQRFWVKNGKFKYYHGRQNDNVSGDYITESKNVKESWIVSKGWNLRYCDYLVAPNTKDSYDISQFGQNFELAYEILQGGNGGSNVKFSWWPVNEDQNVEYGVLTIRSKNCFGCVSLRGKEYCILNKRYTKEEYEALIPKIKKHMDEMPYVDKVGRVYKYGEFFPVELSPFAYNETTAQEYFPLKTEEASKQGFAWKDKKDNVYAVTMQAHQIPDMLEGVGEDITKQVLECRQTGRGFRITPGEFQFHQRTKLPLPDLHPDVRHQKRMERRNPPKYWKRTTADGVEVLTAYSPDRPDQIFSEKGYQQEVI